MHLPLPAGARRWLSRCRRFTSSWDQRPIEEYLDPKWHEIGPYPRSQQLVVEYLARVVADAPRRTMLLDVPCGNARLHRGLAAAHLLSRVGYVGLDLTPTLVTAGKRLVPDTPFVRANAEALPFGPGSFDVVVMQHLLRHLPRYEPAVVELLRVARSLVIVVEKTAAERNRREAYYSEPDHSWFWANSWAPTGICRTARAQGAANAFLLNDARTDDPDGQFIYVFEKAR